MVSFEMTHGVPFQSFVILKINIPVTVTERAVMSHMNSPRLSGIQFDQKYHVSKKANAVPNIIINIPSIFMIITPFLCYILLVFNYLLKETNNE